MNRAPRRSTQRPRQVPRVAAAGLPEWLGSLREPELGRLSATGALTSTRVPLSMPITAVNDGTAAMFAGYGQLVVFGGTTGATETGAWYAVSLPDGAVRSLGTFALPPHQGCENWAAWGIAESVNNDISVLLVEGATAIIRFRLADRSVTRLPFTNLGDMCSITVSPRLNRWYFHTETTNQFSSSSDEIIGSCTASWSTTSP